MQALTKAKKILSELNYDFTTFSLDTFMKFVGERRGYEIVTIPWEGMPLGMFGLWLRDREAPIVYLLYRCNVSPMHQAHIQLHELAHFLLGHPARKLSQKLIREIVNGRASPPFNVEPQMRSQQRGQTETEAETLANLIQQQVVQYGGLARLSSDLSAEQKLANFLKTASL